jgi:hypothetical protein
MCKGQNNDATENNNLDEANAEAEGTGDHVTRIPGGQPAEEEDGVDKEDDETYFLG